MKKTGIFCRKEGMISIWRDAGRVNITLLKILESKKLNDDRVFINDMYTKMHKPQMEDLKKSNIESKKGFIRELDLIDIEKVFDLKFVDVKSKSKGKGFQGVMKRHNFKGGNASHGASLSHRTGGSTGIQDIGRTNPGTKMAGRHGFKNCINERLKVAYTNKDLGVIGVVGSVPGPKKSTVFVRSSLKARN